MRFDNDTWCIIKSFTVDKNYCPHCSKPFIKNYPNMSLKERYSARLKIIQKRYAKQLDQAVLGNTYVGRLYLMTLECSDYQDCLEDKLGYEDCYRLGVCSRNYNLYLKMVPVHKVIRLYRSNPTEALELDNSIEHKWVYMSMIERCRYLSYDFREVRHMFIE
jgi:hypothetical protein